MEVKDELEKFMRGNAYMDADEAVARFKKRHKWKVDELQDRLGKQEWLTVQEREILVFRDDDPPHKIEAMSETLGDIGMGH